MVQVKLTEAVKVKEQGSLRQVVDLVVAEIEDLQPRQVDHRVGPRPKEVVGEVEAGEGVDMGVEGVRQELPHARADDADDLE